MKVAIDCVHYPISNRLSSHRSSWARYWKWYLQTIYPEAEIDILTRGDESKWKTYDAIYFYQGMEWNGKLNLAGGIAPWHESRFRKYAELFQYEVGQRVSGENPWLYSIEVDMPNYYELLKSRGLVIEELRDVHEKVNTIGLKLTEQIVLGDSHALSVMNSSDSKFIRVFRTDFKSLHGALEIGLKNIHNIDWSNVKKCTFFFGMIDLRHHVYRNGGLKSIDDLMVKYEDQLRELSNSGVEIELVEMYPMTKDSRKIPKSGFYKGAPFYGDLNMRLMSVGYFNDALRLIAERNGFSFYQQPDILKDQDGTMDEYFMEKPRSVHMSSEFYRFDLDKGETREW